VQLAQAQVQITDANRRPTVGVGIGAQRAPNSQGRETSTLTAGLQMASWEIDFFGRLQSLSEAARANLAASDAGRRAATLSVAAQVVSTALTLQADLELLDIAQRTLASREATLRLTALREQVGAASALELNGQRALVAQAAATRAQFQRAVAQDRHALALLVGRSLADHEWPTLPLAATSLSEVPVGVSSQVLLRRPDVMQAEQTLLAARAQIAAARAAFWPSITLTAQGGIASATLSGLVQGGNFAYTAAANAVLAIFDSGRRQAGLNSATTAQQVALAQYERAVQSAFRDTADALSAGVTWRDQLAAQLDQRAAVRETARLTDLRARQGVASELERLDAERNLLVAEQAVVQLQLAELINRVALFRALGGPPAP
jgi:outer membrane protein, multidrug efflux system